MVRNTIIDRYLSSGKNLMPLDGKIPRTGWRNTIYPRDKLFSHNDNIGWQISNKDLVIDIDPRNGGVESFKKLEKQLKIKLDYTVKTPRGGHHIYLKIPENYIGLSFKKTLKEFPGVDFLTEGSYCLICDCKTKDGKYIWVDDLFGSFVQLDAPEEVLKLISFESNVTITGEDLGDFNGIIGGTSSTWPEDKVLVMLDKLDPSMKNDEWVKVGMALHDWDPIKGKELWEEWSQAGDNYEEGETDKRWKSFKIGHGVTLGTISYMVKEVAYDEASEKVNEIINKIQYSNEKQIEFELFPKIRKLGFSKIALEKIAKTIQDRLKELTKARMPISEIRNEISYNGVMSGEFIENGEIPEWTKSWVYVNSHTCFANLEALRLLKTEAFNLRNGKYVPDSTNGSKQSAVKYVADRGFIETVDMMAYLPNINESIVTIDDFKVLNSFNSKTVPKAVPEYTEDGLKAIELVKKHIKFICGNDKNSHIFTQWIAHQIQFPGKQILWSPVIQSIQGVGKSFFGELLRCCLGDRNVGTVSPTQVVSDFNGWATGVSVNVLEELRMKGRNRHDAVNSLKPLVTDRMIQINDKGVKQFMTYNTTNYICFTNYKDSIPLDSDDRRWWVIFVPIDSLDEMAEIVGESIVTYFPKLFHAVRTYGCEIRKWLLEFEITKEFLAIKQAPMTDDKMSMIATEESSLEGYVEVKEMIEKGGKYYNKDVVSSSDLFSDLMFDHPDLEIKTNKRNQILKKLGFTTSSKPIKIDGKSRRVWTKKGYDNEKIRKLLG
jgi:hypothetical protein